MPQDALQLLVRQTTSEAALRVLLRALQERPPRPLDEPRVGLRSRGVGCGGPLIVHADRIADRCKPHPLRHID